MSEPQSNYLPRLAYRLEDAAVVTGLSRTRLFGAVRDKKLKAHKDGKATIVLVDDLRDYLESLPTRD